MVCTGWGWWSPFDGMYRLGVVVAVRWYVQAGGGGRRSMVCTGWGWWSPFDGMYRLGVVVAVRWYVQAGGGGRRSMVCTGCTCAETAPGGGVQCHQLVAQGFPLPRRLNDNAVRTTNGPCRGCQLEFMEASDAIIPTCKAVQHVLNVILRQTVICIELKEVMCDERC